MLCICCASQVAQLVNNPPAMWETWVQSLVGKIFWKRERLPTPVFWPGESHELLSMFVPPQEIRFPCSPSSLSVQFSSVTQSCPTLCDPMNCSTPGLPVHHQLLKFTQTHVHHVSDAIQPFHPLSSPSPPASNPSQH